MQTNREHKGRPSKSHHLKRLRSVTKYPRKEPTLIIGFALQETYDNLVTAKQKNCGSKSPKSPQASEHTITPKGSTCSLSTEEIDKKQHDATLPEELLSNAGCDRDEGGDLEMKRLSLEECIIVKNMGTPTKLEPELIFESSGIKKLKQRTTNKKNKHKYLTKTKNVHSKRKDSKRVNKKICKYFEENHINLNTMQSDSISKMLSRSRILKKVSAKESLVEDEHSKDSTDKDSISASFITAKESFFSYTSQDTLTYKESNSDVKGSDCDLSKAESASSVIRILPEERFSTVINVSRAVIQNGTFSRDQNVKMAPSTNTLVMPDLTSTETVINPVTLTSAPMSELSSKYPSDGFMNPTVSDISTERLTEGERISTTEASDEDDTFYNAKTSSYFNKFENETNSEVPVKIERPDAFIKDAFAKVDPYTANSSLMDTVINLGMFPEITSHNSIDYSNDVIVTGNLNHIYANHREEQALGYDQSDIDKIIAKNITQKPFHPEVNVNYIKPKTDLNFVNESAITDILQRNGKHDNVTRTEELSASNHPSNLFELWEKLLIALDSTAKKIEESLSEKIIKEMKDMLGVLNKSSQMKDVETGNTQPISEVNNSGDTDVSAKKEVFPDDAQSKLEQGLQCNLVENQLIDEIMLIKSRSDRSKSGLGVLHQSSSKLIEHCFEVLKPPDVVVSDRGDLVTITDEDTVAGPSTKVYHSSYPVYLRLLVIWTFLKENLFVLMSVPALFAVIIVFYLIVLLMVHPF